MADFTGSKEDFSNQTVAICRQLVSLNADLVNLNAAYSIHGFNVGGPNAIVNADFTNSNKHLTATIVADALFAIGGAASALAPLLAALRNAIPGGLP